MSNIFDEQVEGLAQRRDGVLDLIATVVLRCGGVPNGTIVGVMFTGQEDMADHHSLQVRDVEPYWLDEDGDVVVASYDRAQEFLPQMASAAAVSRAERVALLTFGVPREEAVLLTGNVVMGLQLPAQRVAVTDQGWTDLDDEEVFGQLSEVVHSRAASSAVMGGLPFPAKEFEK